MPSLTPPFPDARTSGGGQSGGSLASYGQLKETPWRLGVELSGPRPSDSPCPSSVLCPTSPKHPPLLHVCQLETPANIYTPASRPVSPIHTLCCFHQPGHVMTRGVWRQIGPDISGKKRLFTMKTSTTRLFSSAGTEHKRLFDALGRSHDVTITGFNLMLRK